MAPVAGSPPNRGDRMLAIPWPTSSTFGLCLSPLMRSETTADISDSIAPSMATVMAGEISGRSDRKFENDNHRRSQEQSDDITGDSLHEDHEENNHYEPANR